MIAIRCAPLLLLSLLLTITFTDAAVTRRDKHSHGKRPSVIFLVPDGYGIATHTLAREVDRIRKGSNTGYFHQLPLDKHQVGTIQTKSSSALVTDSAAAGTSFACGESTTNGFIGFENNTEICATVLEGAKAQGYYTGLVTTTRITHATPAVFSSHTYNRDDEATIASQQLGGYVLGRQADLLFGGGRGFFLPQSDEDSSRTDDRNLLAEAKEQGWQVLESRSDFDSYSGQIPTLGVFSRSHMSFEIDRDEAEQPSLIEMSTKALNVLDAQDEPFFIMIESGRIDHAGHGNDAAAIVADALHFNKLFETVKSWVDERETCTGAGQHDYILISSADHETGGLDLPGGWRPDWLNATTSIEELTAKVEEETADLSDEEVTNYVRDEAFIKALGFTPSDDDVAAVVEGLKNATTEGYDADEYAVSNLLTGPVNEAIGIKWGQNDHSQVDVGLYVYTKKYDGDIIKSFIGSHPNYFLGRWITQKLNLDLETIQKTLAGDSSLGNQTYLEEVLASGGVGT